MRVILSVMVLLGAAGLWAAGERKGYTPEQIEGWDEFKKAAPGGLKEDPRLEKWTPPAVKALTKELIEKIESEIAVAARKLKTPEPHDLQWNHHRTSTSVYHRWKGGKEYMGAFVDLEREEVRGYYLKGVPELRGIEQMLTAELFEDYCAALYEKLFGVKPNGVPKFQWDGDGVRRFGKEHASWGQSRLAGFPVRKSPYVSVDRDANGVWTIQVHRGASKEEIADVARRLKDRPVRVTRREAIAIAWKSWVSVREGKSDESKISGYCALQSIAHESDPWDPAKQPGTRIWRSVDGSKQDSNDRIYYVAEFYMGSHILKMWVDRNDGRLVRMTQEVFRW